MNNNDSGRIDLLAPSEEQESSDQTAENPSISKKKIALIASPILFIIVLVVLVKVKYSFFNSVKNKVVASQYKCEVNYKLENKKCVLTKEQKPVLLGNVNGDSKIDQNDVDVLELLLDAYEFSDVSYSASDIDRNGVVDSTDLELLTGYVKNNTNDYDIGIQKVCPMDNDISTYHLNKKQNKCVQVIAKDAAKKNEKEVQLEQFDNNTGSSTNSQGGYGTSQSYYSTSNNTSNSYTGYYGTSTVVTRYSNTVSEPPYNTDSSNYSTAYYNYSPYPSTHAYNYPSYNPYNTSGNTSGGYNTYNTSSNTSGGYNTNYNPTPVLEEKPTVIEDTNKSKIFYSNDSLISIKEVQTPNKKTEYNLNAELSIELDIEQKGTGFYYYDVKTYYSSNDYNDGFLNTVSSCQSLKTNNIKELKLKVASDDNRLIFNVYADKDCRSQALKARYVSSIYSTKNPLKASKLTEKNYKINSGLNVFVLKPVNSTSNYYRIRYSISDGKNYYVKENKECLRVVHGMNQLRTSTNKNLELYSDKKCKTELKKINLDK